MKTTLGYLVAFLVILAICGNAMRITGLDNQCTNAGGRLEGVLRPKCVYPPEDPDRYTRRNP